MAAVTHIDVSRRPRVAHSRPFAPGLAGPTAPCWPRGDVDAVVYRRRRLVALMLITVLAVALAGPIRAGAGHVAGFWSSGGSSVSRAETVRIGPAADGTYLVEPGDTLWTIAQRLDPGVDPRPLVDRLAELNGGANLRAGQYLVLPP